MIRGGLFDLIRTIWRVKLDRDVFPLLFMFGWEWRELSND